MAKKSRSKKKTTKTERAATTQRDRSQAAIGRSKAIGRASVSKGRVPIKSDRGEVIEVIARGVATDGQRVLLCQNLKHGYLYLPGGHVEFAESAAAALAREFLEETGVAATVGRLLMADESAFATKKRTHHEINLVFHVELPGTSKPIRSKEPGIGFEWVDLAAVPDLDIRPLSAKALLAAGARLGGSSAEGGAEWVSSMASK